MPAGVISVGGKKYAVGLFWQVSDNKNAGRAAKAAALQPGSESDFYALRAGNARGRASQFGLAEKNVGHKWNMPSAAVSLANRQPGSWAGVFTIPQGVWFIEVRDDLIAPDGDQLLANESEAMMRLQEASARGGLERIYAPPAWAIPGAESGSLPSLLSGRADGRLQPVKIPRKVVLSGLGGLALLIVLIGGFIFIRHQQEDARLEQEALEAMAQSTANRKLEDERRQKEEAERLRQQQEQALQLPSYQRMWEGLPTPIAWLTACREAMSQVVLSPLGWKLDGAVCANNLLNVRWSRAGGPAIVPEGAQVDVGLTTAARTIALPARPARGPQLLWPPEAVLTYALQNDLKADLTYLPDEPPPPGPSGQSMPPPLWKKRTFKMATAFSPWNLKGPLVDLPGLILQSLVWNQNGTWQLEGIFYEQRK